MSISTTYVSRAGNNYDSYANAAYAEDRIGGPCTIISAMVANNGASDRWFMMFMSTTKPANGESPTVCVRVNTGEQVNVPISMRFVFGVTWVVSSTATTLTYDAAATFGVQLRYET
jgi:hypothetical protein